MRTTKTLFLFSLTLLLFSCSNDDDNQSIPDNHLILGTWMLVDYKVEINSDDDQLNGILESYILQEYHTDNPGGGGSTITFQKNGKAILTSYPETEVSELSFKLNDEEHTITFSANGERLTRVYAVSAYNLTFSSIC